MPTPLPNLRLDTSALPAAKQRELLQDRFGESYEISVSGPEQAGCGLHVNAWLLGRTMIDSRTASSLRLSRGPCRVRADGLDHYIVNVTRSGQWHADANGTMLSGAPGSVVVIDMGRPLDATVSASDTIGCTIPRETLDRLIPGGVPHGTLLPGPAASLLADYIVLLERRLPQLTMLEAPFVERATAEMIAACIAPSAERLEQAGAPMAASLRAQASRVVDCRLHDPALSVTQIAGTLRISRASLYRLFETEGGVHAFIWARRLRRARRLLADPGERRRISQIAVACGFTSEPHFSRAFRRAFGASPSEVRSMRVPATRAASGSADQLLRIYQRWEADLSA